MPILSPQEVDALIQSSKIENKEQDLALSQAPPETNIKKVTVASNKDTNFVEPISLQFEKKYPALELVLGRFCDFLEKSLARFFETKSKIAYQSVQEQLFKKLFAVEQKKENYFLGYYEIKPTANFVIVIFETSFLEHLFITKLGVDAFTKNKPQEIKKKYQQMIKELFTNIEQNWNLAWRQLYPLQTEFVQFLTLQDLLDTKIKNKRAVQFSFVMENLGKKHPFFIAFEANLLQQLSKTKISISSFLPNKIKKKMFLEKIVKEKTKVSCSLGSYKINLQELLSLEKNDTILIDFQKGDAIFFSIADEKKFIGKFFSHKNKKAIRLIKSLK